MLWTEFKISVVSLSNSNPADHFPRFPRTQNPQHWLSCWPNKISHSNSLTILCSRFNGEVGCLSWWVMLFVVGARVILCCTSWDSNYYNCVLYITECYEHNSRRKWSDTSAVAFWKTYSGRCGHLWSLCPLIIDHDKLTQPHVHAYNRILKPTKSCTS